MTLVHANLSWDTFEVSCLCTGVRLSESRAHVSILFGSLGQGIVHRSHFA